jgi:hypothetical protein
MSEQLLPVRVEVWPLAADSRGIWLLSGDDAWRSAPIGANSEPHEAVTAVLGGYVWPRRPAVLHSTSWRADDGAVILTYVAIVPCPESESVRTLFAHAMPVSLRVAQEVGRPIATDPAEAPLPRYIDVLLHAIRHLRFLVDTDAGVREAMGDVWRQHLSPLSPVLAGMYERR